MPGIFSDDHGDRPRPLPEIPELRNALDITKRKDSPSWGFDEVDGCWKWIKPTPFSRVIAHTGKSEGKRSTTVRDKLLKGFSCFICKQVMANPVTTPCAHNFCKSCLEEVFSGQSFVRERSRGGKALRSQKNIMKCPSCKNDISDFLSDPQVNRELMEVIESLKQKNEEDDDLAEELNEEDTDTSEVISDLMPESSKSSGKHHEQTSATGGSENSPVLERAKKRTKVDVEGSLGTDNDGEETAIAAEKPDGLDVDSEAGEVQTGNAKVGNKDSQAEEAMEEENNSLVSPLFMLSDGQDSA